MESKVLSKFEKIGSHRLFLILGSLTAIVAVSSVLVLTFVRIQNPQPTIEQPKAAGVVPSWCSSPPSCCKDLTAKGYDACPWPERGQCFESQCNSAAWDAGQAGCSGPSVPRCRCAHFRHNTFADGSYACGAPGDGPFGAGGGGGGGGGGTGGGGTGVKPSAGTAGPITVFVSDANCKPYSQSVTVRMGSTSTCPSGCNNQCSDPVCNPNRERSYGGSGSVSWPTSMAGASYAFFLKELPAPKPQCTVNAGSNSRNCTIVVGGAAGSCDLSGGGGACTQDSNCQSTGENVQMVCVNGTCTRASQTHLACGSGNTCVRVSGSGNNLNGCTSVGASCTTSGGSSSCTTDADCPSGQGCVGRTCKPLTQTHLACGRDTLTCVRVSGAGDNRQGCTSVGPSCTPGGEEFTCWNNQGVNGRCFDVNGDGVINILDFSCMASLWLQNVPATGAAPKCGQRE